MYHKIRIGILIENLLQDSGGAENYGLRLAACLKDKYEVKIYCKQGDRLPDQVFRQYNVKPIEIYEYRFVSSKLKIVRAIEKRNRQKILNHIIPVECDVFINCTSNRFVGYKDKIKSIHIM